MDHVLNINEGGMYNKSIRARTNYLKSKSVKTNACGQQVLNQYDRVEQLWFKNLEEYWDDNNQVSRAVIFLIVLGIDPSFKVSGGFGVKGSREHLQQLKQWFYFFFK